MNSRIPLSSEPRSERQHNCIDLWEIPEVRFSLKPVISQIKTKYCNSAIAGSVHGINFEENRIKLNDDVLLFSVLGNNTIGYIEEKFADRGQNFSSTLKQFTITILLQMAENSVKPIHFHQTRHVLRGFLFTIFAEIENPGKDREGQEQQITT